MSPGPQTEQHQRRTRARAARLLRLERRLRKEADVSECTGPRDELQHLADQVRDIRLRELKVARDRPGQDWI